MTVSASNRSTTWPSSGRIKPEILTINGIATGIIRAGHPENPPLVLLHGFSGDMLTWQFNIGALARGYRVVAIDLPGHGRSGGGADLGYWRALIGWLTETLRALDITHPHLVGHSLGARLALGLAEEAVVAVRSLTLIACAGISPNYDFAFLQRLIRIGDLADATACSRHLFGGAEINVDRFARALHAKLASPEVQATLHLFLERNFADGRLVATGPLDWSRVSCPVQIIWGRDDPVVEIPPADWLPATAPVHLLDRVGHLPHLAAPDAVNRLLEAFAGAP